jgi:hypothetical protein
VRLFTGHDREKTVIARFTRYLNSPMGKSVLENLEEGESFVLQTSEFAFRVTKKEGKAEVTIISDFQNTRDSDSI